MEYLIKIGSFVYAYCTDFIINLANILNLSYYEINALLFCIIWPLVTLFLFFVFVIQKIRLNRIKMQKQ